MIRIMCYGDSNTYGYNPKTHERFDENTRWTGLLQNKLLDDYKIIEEGLNGRDVLCDHPLFYGRNGLTTFPIIFESQLPLDMIVIMLGTNDMKSYFNMPSMMIANGMEQIIQYIEDYHYDESMSAPKILLVSPILIGSDIEDEGIFDETSARKSEELAPLYETIAKKHDCLFLDASRITEPSVTDRLHLDEAGHQALADAIYNIISNYYE